MATKTKRTIVYLDPLMHKALRMKSEAASRSLSQLINEAVRLTLAEDAADLAAFDERESEPMVSFQDVLNNLKEHGRL